MENITNASTVNNNEEIFTLDIIEENGISEDMLCNTMGCA